MRANTENLLEILGFLQFLAMYGLVSSLNEDEILNFLEMISQNEYALELSRPFASAYKISEVIQCLIGRKKLIDAVRLACAFGLTDKFPPNKLLTEYMEYAKSCTRQLSEKKKSIKEKVEATDKEIVALRTVVQCIIDYDLESQLPSSTILKRIALLEKIKNDRRHSALFFQSKDEQQQQQLQSQLKQHKSKK
ncbi:Frigida-like [Trema orientale]|uniref:FRIGIDA-like protein n=1 Tax=Trema orientale TaxID=63057 RepID=A0A2P5CQ17_TREOI|nr:Frigida-like [Trema orientale]